MKLVRLASLTVCLSLSAGLLKGPPLKAQALTTARRNAEITAFGGYSLTDPDFGGRSYNGETIGAGFTMFPHWLVDPSFDVRFNHASNSGISEHAFLIGPRAQKDYGRFHPYANFLAGIGTISYHPEIVQNDSHDTGRVFAYGGGVDIDVTPKFSAKIDFQQQSWNLGKDPDFTGSLTRDYTLAPRVLTFGVTYHIPFSGLRKQKTLYER